MSRHLLVLRDNDLRVCVLPGPGGHGLGLAIVRAIAGAHDATVAARAREGGGLDIDVTFPSRAGQSHACGGATAG